MAIARILQDRKCVILSPMRQVVSNDQLSICLWTATIQSFLWCVSRWWTLEWPCNLWRVSKQSTLDRHSLQSLWRSVWIMLSEKRERERDRESKAHSLFWQHRRSTVLLLCHCRVANKLWLPDLCSRNISHFSLVENFEGKIKCFELLLARPQKQLTTDGLQFVEQTVWCEHNKTCRESEYTCFMLFNKTVFFFFFVGRQLTESCWHQCASPSLDRPAFPFAATFAARWWCPWWLGHSRPSSTWRRRLEVSTKPACAPNTSPNTPIANPINKKYRTLMTCHSCCPNNNS